MSGGNDEGFTCKKMWYWTIQVLLWMSLILIIVGFSVKDFWKTHPEVVFPPFAIFYLVYWINLFCSATFSYLLHQKESQSIYNYMSNLFYSPAQIEFNITCYHYNTRQYIYKDSNGREQWRTETYRENSFSEISNFKYMSWRDISGPFILNTQGFEGDPKLAMVKLRLEFNIEFANDGTVNDFEAQKNYFIQKNQFKDTHYDFNQSNSLNGFNEYNLVSLGENPNPRIGMCYLILSTFLCLNEFYKMYVDSYCIHQDFRISKVLSTRTNLNLQQNFQSYQEKVPSIIIANMTTVYNDPSRLGEVSVVPDLPNLEELEKTQKRSNIEIRIGENGEPNKLDEESSILITKKGN